MNVCPYGWHLPSNADWNVLMKSINPSCSDNSDCAGAGIKLKATSGWNNNGNGTDTYGFSALPGGFGGYGSFYNAGDSGYWWSASENNSRNAYYRRMYDNYEDANYYSYVKSNLFSVRCLQD